MDGIAAPLQPENRDPRAATARLCSRDEQHLKLRISSPLLPLPPRSLPRPTQIRVDPEFKAGKSPSSGNLPKEEYLDDLAYTVMVARQSGLTIVAASLVLIHRDHRLGGEVPAVVLVDVTEQVWPRTAGFVQLAPGLEPALCAEEQPAPSLQLYCNECPHFEGRCIGANVPDSILLLPRLSAKSFAELRHCERISAIPADAELTDPQKRVAVAIQSNIPSIDRDVLSTLDGVRWPAYYLDFEAVSPAFPWFPDTPPYAQLPFQYSVDVCSADNQLLAHREYLAPPVGDWRLELAERLLADLETEGSIIVYTAYEKTRLNALAAQFPQLTTAIEALVARLFDLERIFRTGYIHPRFKGRSSIKAVLPALAPGEGYGDLAIGDGETAMAVFGLMRVGAWPEDTHAKHRNDLLQYCGRDTRAMFLVHREALALWRAL